ncbi:MAG: hypothetical protein A2987_02935 [Omnitrophica bacterium RIFCSPLOWO2_01_FULL_45_10]|nr:MAG: hypothetical protein A2987_02935 [Omnitrophica bacterium RIFCSPLOWO2_01_FULL_45_10]
MKKERIIFKGKLLKVLTKKVRLPNGYIANLEIVKHPGAALIVPLLTKNKIIMLRQYRPVINSYIYELPAGTLEKGEPPLSCARREIIEETGFRARKLTLLGKIYPAPGYTTEKIFIYKAEKLQEVKRNVEDDEVIEIMYLNKIEVRRLFRKGRIVDAKTVAALAFIGWI